MLELVSLELENFGPFKGRQRIEFPSSGVIVVYGENGRGKTTLLNALRYAFLGKMLRHGGSLLPTDRMVNWEALADGDSQFHLTLDFKFEDHVYRIVRTYRKTPVGRARRDLQDAGEEFYMVRDGEVLPPASAGRECRRIMPEEVSRFFLFDGELLQEYQELLRDESMTGRAIASAIEQILGIPVLTHARLHLDYLVSEAAKREAAEAKKDKTSRALAEQLEEWLERIEVLKREREHYREKLQELKLERDHVLEWLERFQLSEALMRERKQLESEIAQLKTHLTERESKLRQWMSGAWQVLLRQPLDRLLEDARRKLRVAEDTIAYALGQREAAEMMHKALLKGVCPICGRSLDADTRERLTERLTETTGVGRDIEAVREEEKQLTVRIEFLERQRHTTGVEVAKEIRDAIDDLRLQITSRGNRVLEIDQELAGMDTGEISEKRRLYERLVREIAAIEQTVETVAKKLDEANGQVAWLQKKLDQLGRVRLVKERTKRELCQRLRDVFEGSIAYYREYLKHRIEEDATELFRSLISEPEYERLAITANYGLNVVHRDGREIPVRSAGQEHIIALSLIGALQKNAPLQGPIVMDTPFGRLDRQHAERVLAALPRMARQVVLLAHDNEIDPSLTRKVLKGQLKAEYRLTRRSARYTVVEPVFTEG